MGKDFFKKFTEDTNVKLEMYEEGVIIGNIVDIYTWIFKSVFLGTHNVKILGSIIY